MGPVGRIRLQKIAAIALGLGGVSAIAYAGLVPLPPFSTEPVPFAGTLFGVVALIAAVGIFRSQPWGRVLGVCVVGVGIALGVFRILARATEADPMGAVVSLALGLAVDGATLWVLLRYWPARA